MQTQVVLWDDLSSDVREGATFVVSYFSDVHEIKAIISHCQSVVLLYSSLPVYSLAIGSSPFPNQIRKFTHQKCVHRIRFCIYDMRAAGHRMHKAQLIREGTNFTFSAVAENCSCCVRIAVVIMTD